MDLLEEQLTPFKALSLSELGVNLLILIFFRLRVGQNRSMLHEALGSQDGVDKRTTALLKKMLLKIKICLRMAKLRQSALTMIPLNQITRHLPSR